MNLKPLLLGFSLFQLSVSCAKVRVSHDYQEFNFNTMHSIITSPQELIWCGVGTTEIFAHSSHEEIDTMVIDLVESVLDQFPPS